MRLLLTAGPTREPLDPVRYLGNRSSGKMGAAIARAAIEAGHTVTAILGPTETTFPAGMVRVDVETAREMHDAVLKHWPGNDLLIMAAAVADYRPRSVSPTKMSRVAGALTIELEPTEDIAAAASEARSPGQRVVGFSLENEGDAGLERALNKLRTKGLDLIVFNPLRTMNAADITPLLLYADGRREAMPELAKGDFGRVLVERAAGLLG